MAEKEKTDTLIQHKNLKEKKQKWSNLCNIEKNQRKPKKEKGCRGEGHTRGELSSDCYFDAEFMFLM